MSGWLGWLMATVSAAAPPAAGEGATGGNRFEVRTLIGVLSLIIGLLVIMMVLVGMSAVRRRVRAATVGRDGRGKGKRATRRVDAWAEAGRRAELAPPPPLPRDEMGEDESGEGPEERV